jgi:hypothetical protein
MMQTSPRKLARQFERTEDAFKERNSQATLSHLNENFKEVLDSREKPGQIKRYLVVDAKTGASYTTIDPKKASPIAEISKLVEYHSQRYDAADQGSKENQGIKDLIKHFTHLLPEHKKTSVQSKRSLWESFLEKVPNPLPKIASLLNIKKEDDQFDDYIQSPVLFEDKIEFLNGRSKAHPLTIDQVTAGFRKEININFYGSSERALEFVERAFYEAVNETAEEIKNGKIGVEDAILRVEEKIGDYMIKNNRETIEVDREAFRDLMGSLAKAGIGNKSPHLHSEQLKRLIQEYDNGTWQDEKDENGEATHLRKIEIENLSPQLFNKLNRFLTLLFESNAMKELLTNYFNSVKI